MDSDDQETCALPPVRPPTSRPVVDLEVRRLDADAPERAARASVTSAGLVISGQVSAGRRGWHVTGVVLRRRRRLVLQLVARRSAESAMPPAIELLEYRALVTGLPSGKFDVYQSVMFIVPGVPAQLPEPQFVGSVTLPTP